MAAYRRNSDYIGILHKHIIDDTVTEKIVKKFRLQHPEWVYAWDRNRKSAAFIALKCDKIGTYEMLIANGFSLSPDEDIHVLVEEICKSRRIVDKNEALKIKKRLRLIHLPYFKSASPRHLNILVAKSMLSLSCSGDKRREYLEYISKAFEDLNEIEDIVPLLKLAANLDCLAIIFDFLKISVEHMAPTAKKTSLGLTSHNIAYVYIGAKGLSNEFTRYEVLGTLAHELCHCAMKLVYNNDCRPYMTNSSKEVEFEKINSFCFKYKDADDIIGRVYNCSYLTERYHAELITRVPQLMAVHKRRQTELEDRRKKFSGLFDYYSSTVKDMKLKLETDEASAKLQKLNVVCGALTSLENPEIYNTPGDMDALNLYLSNVDSRLLNVATNCSELTMISIYKKLKPTDKLYSFTKLEHFEKYEMNNIESLFRLLEKLIIVIDCDGHNQQKIEGITAKLRKCNMNSRVIFVTNHFTSLVGYFTVNHPWMP